MLSRQTSVGIYGGMGALTGYDFFKLFVDLIPAKSDADHPEITFVSMPWIPRRDHCVKILEEKREILPEEDARPGLKEGMDRFKQAAVNFVVAPCNTFHYFREELQAYSGIEILNMISIVLHSILAKNPAVKRVGLLSTKSTAKYKIYDKEFNQYGIEVIKPTDEEQDIVLEVIDLVKQGKQNKEETAAKLIKVINALEKQRVDCIILGCTELPLVNLKNYRGKLKLINSTFELAKATAYRVCKEMRLDLVEFEKLVKAKENQSSASNPHRFYQPRSFNFSRMKNGIGLSTRLLRANL